MSDAPMERLRRTNPVADEMVALPIEPLLQRLDQQSRTSRSDPVAVKGRGGARRWLPRLGSVVAVVSVLVAVVIGAGALVLLAGHKRSTPITTAATPGRQQLIDIVAVLRRPQTKADLSLDILSRLEHRSIAALAGFPDLPLVRFATTTPWGERLYLVPMKPPTAKELASFARQFRRPASVIARLHAQGETLGVLSSQGGGGAGTAVSIEAGQGMETEGAGRSFAGGSTETRFVLVVPDGVAKVEFVVPRQSSPDEPGAPIYRHSLAVTVAVHDNVAAAQVDREWDGGPVPMIWYSADGQGLKRIGNFAIVNRVIAPPQPGPQTALSRAAQRDPSTPNRVWVTPVAGGPHTNFKLHFRVLLNDADYSYRMTGTRCPAITFNGGDGGGSMDVRGRIWSDVVDAVDGQTWCHGTYHLTATVMDLGRYGMLKHPADPFGTATFTVRP
jgi:hypothetical protein